MLTLFCILFASIPLIVWNGRYEVPKVFAFLLAGIFLIIYFLFNYQKIKIDNKDKWYLLWILTLTLSTRSLLGGSYRNQGVIFFICLWLVIKFVELLTLKQKNNLYKFIGATVLIESIIVIFGYKLGTIGDINAVSGFLAIGIYFIRWLFIFPLVAMILNFSKTGFLALIPYLFKKINIILILILIPLIFIFKPINLSSPFENREVIWKHSINLIIKKPILGYGAESNEAIFNKEFYESGFPLSNLIVDRAHNLFLDITLWSGLVGLIFFCKFLLETYKKLDIDMKKVFLSFLIFSMFQPLSVVHWLLFALIM